MEEKIGKLHEMIKEIFPDAVSVKVFANCEGIDVTPDYKTNLADYAMRNISGEWVKRRKSS